MRGLMAPASLLLVLTLAAPPSFEQLREQGTRAYQAKQCTVVSADVCSGRVGVVCGREPFKLPGEELEQRRKAPAQQKQEER